MNKISAVIITKNAEVHLADCLDSVAFCDEIIMIDSGSTDRTVDLGKHLGAKTYESRSRGFAAKRNMGLEKAKYKWILYIDADERISSELKKSIAEVLKKTKSEFGAYKLQRKNFYLGNHEWPAIEKMERLFDKNSIERWIGDLHETAIVKGEVGELDGEIIHYTHQDLSKMVEKTAEWSGIEAELRYKSNHPKMKAWRFFRVMLSAFYGSYFRQKGYKAGTAGLVESIYQSFSMFITYARLWELQNDTKSK